MPLNTQKKLSLIWENDIKLLLHLPLLKFGIFLDVFGPHQDLILHQLMKCEGNEVEHFRVPSVFRHQH